MMGYVDELLDCINDLEATHKKIQKCEVFLQKHAARKKLYVATDYFKDQIASITDAKEEGWETQVKQLTELMEEQNEVRRASQG